MSNPLDVELILRVIDDARRDWQQEFTTPISMDPVEELFQHSTNAVVQLSISTDDNEQSKLNRLKAEQIVSKLKELRNSLADKLPIHDLESLKRDIFQVNQYHVKAAEFFKPAEFYPGDKFIMKLYRWSIYDVNDCIVCRYYLERSEMIPGEPYYVLGKCYANRHEQIQPYGSTVPEYNAMKIHVINDLKGEGPPPIISSYRN